MQTVKMTKSPQNFTLTRISCYTGLFVQAIINNFLPILFIVFRTDYGLSYEELGRLIFINFAVQIFADFISPKIATAIGYKKTAFLCQFLAAFGLLFLSVATKIISNTYLAIIISVIVYAFGSGIIEVILSPIIELLPSKNKGREMAILHSFYCWGQLCTVIITTFLLKLLGFSLWEIIPLALGIVPAVNSVLFLFSPIIEPSVKTKDYPIKKLLSDKTFICFMIFMLSAGASEITMAQWASLFIQNTLGLNKVLGDLLGPCAFAVFMGLGRVIFAAFSGRFSIRRIFIINGILCAVCYLLVAFCSLPVFSLIACAICGFTVSLSWPLTYSIASAKFLSAGTVMFSLLALCGDFGCSLGPWLLGVFADICGFNIGFAVSAVFPLLIVITALFFLEEKDCKIN